MNTFRHILFGILITLIIISVSWYTTAANKSKKTSSEKVVENFSRYPLHKFPKSFRTYPFQRSKAMKVYKVAEEEGNKYLQAIDSKDLSIIIFRRFFWNVKKTPYLSWQWRAKTLPKGADERHSNTNDSACGVYVDFGKYTGKIIKYTWSTTVPVGTVIPKKPNKFDMIVKETGKKNLGKWQTVSVNVLKDYKRLFHSSPKKNPSGFGILTDGNAIHSKAACDYDNFTISQTPINASTNTR